MTQPSATMMPPNATISFGPRRAPSVSTIQPWIGVSHVSSAMKMLKANWIDASDQPCALLIGLTNSVQPYCRLAISTMQMMQAMSWPQRVPSVATAGAPVVVVVTSSSQCVLPPRERTVFVLLERPIVAAVLDLF